MHKAFASLMRAHINENAVNLRCNISKPARISKSSDRDSQVPNSSILDLRLQTLKWRWTSPTHTSWPSSSQSWTGDDCRAFSTGFRVGYQKGLFNHFPSREYRIPRTLFWACVSFYDSATTAYFLAKALCTFTALDSDFGCGVCCQDSVYVKIPFKVGSSRFCARMHYQSLSIYVKVQGLRFQGLVSGV